MTDSYEKMLIDSENMCIGIMDLNNIKSIYLLIKRYGDEYETICKICKITDEDIYLEMKSYPDDIRIFEYTNKLTLLKIIER